MNYVSLRESVPNETKSAEATLAYGKKRRNGTELHADHVWIVEWYLEPLSKACADADKQ